MNVLPIIVGALETISNNLEKKMGLLEIGGRMETTEITALIKSEWWFKRITGNLLSLKLMRKITSLDCREKFAYNNNNINDNIIDKYNVCYVVIETKHSIT